VVSLARPEAADKLDERRGVGVGETAVHVDAHLIHSVHKLQVQWLQQLVLYKLLSMNTHTVVDIDVYINAMYLHRGLTYAKKADHTKAHTHTDQQPFSGPLFGTTRVSRYQKKRSPTHTHPDHQTSICRMRPKNQTGEQKKKIQTKTDMFRRK